jgi:hypothetical protein
MKVFLAALLAACFVISYQVQCDAKARLIAVFPIRSTPELATPASEATRTVTSRLASIDGFDAKVMAAPSSGTLGIAAASGGAAIYVVGQLLATDTGFQLILASFDAATDKPLGEYRAVLPNAGALPGSPDLRLSLIPSTSTAADQVATRAGTGFQQPPAVQSSLAGVQPAQQVSDGVVVPTGLSIAISLDAPVSSGSAQVGDKFAFKAVKDILADGLLVIRKGAQGEGQIASVERAGSNGHPGKLGLQFNWIAASDGSKVQLTDTARTDEGEAKKGAASTATIASYVLLGPLGFFAHNFVKGRDVTLDENSKLTVYVDHSVRVSSQEVGTTQPGFAPDANARAGPVSAIASSPDNAVRRGTAELPMLALNNWNRVPEPTGNPARTVSQWSLDGRPGQPAQSVTVITDSGSSYVDELQKIRKNFQDNNLIASIDADIACRGRQSHVIEFGFGQLDNETVISRVLIPETTGLTTITYSRPKSVSYDPQVRRAIDTYCAAPSGSLSAARAL